MPLLAVALLHWRQELPWSRCPSILCFMIEVSWGLVDDRKICDLVKGPNPLLVKMNRMHSLEPSRTMRRLLWSQVIYTTQILWALILTRRIPTLQQKVANCHWWCDISMSLAGHKSNIQVQPQGWKHWWLWILSSAISCHFEDGEAPDGEGAVDLVLCQQLTRYRKTGRYLSVTGHACLWCLWLPEWLQTAQRT